MSDALLSGLYPGVQVRDWRLRWKLIEAELALVVSHRTVAMNADTIQAAQQRLVSFLIQTYHFKDALIDAAPSLGISKSDIEDAVNADARLALLADLANVEKHVKLTRPPRSGTLPKIGSVSGQDQSGGGWRLSVPVIHGVRTLDGLDVAVDAVNAWRHQLAAWNLI